MSSDSPAPLIAGRGYRIIGPLNDDVDSTSIRDDAFQFTPTENTVSLMAVVSRNQGELRVDNNRVTVPITVLAPDVITKLTEYYAGDYTDLQNPPSRANLPTSLSAPLVTDESNPKRTFVIGAYATDLLKARSTSPSAYLLRQER